MDRLSASGPGYIRFAAPALVLIGAGFDLLTPADYHGGPLLAVACVAAGATLSFRSTLALSALALATATGLTVRHGTFGHAPGVTEIVNVLLAGVIGLVVNRVIARYGRRLDTVRTVSEAAQRAILPTPPRHIGPLDIAARYRAAQSEARIGGDLYAAEDSPYGIRLLIGDVRGKGLGAVGAVSVVLGAFREAAEQAPDLLELAERLEHALVREGIRRSGEDRTEGFTTALLAEFSPDYRTLRLLNRGHPAPYLLVGGTVRALDAAEPDLPLGIGGLCGRRSGPDVHRLPPGGTLLLVTDGVTEARDGAGVFYDPAERLAGRGPFQRPQDVIDALVSDVETWSGGHGTDDMAVLAVTYR
ncbi:PP2C family protein-serine/threonine phosphatase [Streptomyces sp. H10-C2]|uniref:PP2C family protein-serine/threonine phosphatase n=1 Tax=unclassified Streptomyces TaxID=2593676 RepID=UPI0024B9ACF6|nr:MULTISPECIES: PP2C family protein-serine/threonine phosphatase [unclassified Streptomyces]MDJ0343995.1 PP2C family protein-serine/threonine phosphatase [Streptomyces sp. PH10-H1]MDJ0373514.1 PP2C family protein-serine/threonine phosphatase [Streptomyces sp. H10-C2]